MTIGDIVFVNQPTILAFFLNQSGLLAKWLVQALANSQVSLTVSVGRCRSVCAMKAARRRTWILTRGFQLNVTDPCRVVVLSKYSLPPNALCKLLFPIHTFNASETLFCQKMERICNPTHSPRALIKCIK